MKVVIDNDAEPDLTAKVVDIRSVKPSRSDCRHEKGFVVDPQQGIVQCAACDENVSALYALIQVARQEEAMKRRWQRLTNKIQEAADYVPRLRAVKRLERTWSGRKMLPTCPHCRRAVRAEDLAIMAVGITVDDGEIREKDNG